MRSSKTSRFSTFFLRRVTSPVSVPSFSALRMETVMRSGLAGLTRKSLAPARMASTAESMPPLAVSTITGSSERLTRNFAITAMPSMSGMTRSRRTSETWSPRGPFRRSSAGWPPGAVTTFMPLRVIAASRSRRCTGSSSTIRIVCGIGVPWFRRCLPKGGKGRIKVSDCNRRWGRRLWRKPQDARAGC